MPFGNLGGPTLILILFIVLLLFGAPKLPALARSLGQSARILKKEVSGDDEKQAEGTANSEAATQAPAPTQAQAAQSEAPAAPPAAAGEPGAGDKPSA